MHVCIGAHVARLEGVVLVQELLARFPGYEVDEAGLAREVSEFHVGWARMPIVPSWAYGGRMTQLIIDADTHLTEPPDVWTARVPAQYLDQVPHVVRNDEGRDVWVLDGTPFSSPGLTAVAGWPEPFPAGPKTYEECHPAVVRRQRAPRLHGRGGDLGAGPLPERRRVRQPALPLASATTT